MAAMQVIAKSAVGIDISGWRYEAVSQEKGRSVKAKGPDVKGKGKRTPPSLACLGPRAGRYTPFTAPQLFLRLPLPRLAAVASGGPRTMTATRPYLSAVYKALHDQGTWVDVNSSQVVSSADECLKAWRGRLGASTSASDISFRTTNPTKGSPITDSDRAPLSALMHGPRVLVLARLAYTVVASTIADFAIQKVSGCAVHVLSQLSTTT